MKSSYTAKKRVRLTTSNDESYAKNLSEFANIKPLPPTGLTAQSPASSFRNVSACHRCRSRKNRCDQNLPACSSCEKVGVKCVGFDPITKREVPRTYVYYLESRINYLESLLSEQGVEYAPSQDFDLGAEPILEKSVRSGEGVWRSNASSGAAASNGKPASHSEAVGPKGNDSGSLRDEWEVKQDEAERVNKLVSNVGMFSVKGAPNPLHRGSTSDISFARVVFTAVRSSVPGIASEREGNRPTKLGSPGFAATSGASMRDSFFGLYSKPTIKQASFPDRSLGLSLVELYFEHANPQIPILHRGEFMTLFERAYTSKDRPNSARELYMLNIVFAIGAGIILETSCRGQPLSPTPSETSHRKGLVACGSKKGKSSQQKQPEEYHASAMMYLHSCLESGPSSDRPEGLGGGLEELQAVLLLAGFALLRPVAPGLWYITGVAVRLGVDLGLYYEDETGVVGEGKVAKPGKANDSGIDAAGHSSTADAVDEKEKGRREWVRDLRRRLWWCLYSFDRLVSTCVGRPFGITDQVITTPFPSILDDAYITSIGFKMPSNNHFEPSYKRVAHHYFRLRLLQSEILEVLQYRQAQKAHSSNRTHGSQYMHTRLPSTFLQPFDSFHAWRKDIDHRLWEWKESAPLQDDTTVQFSVKFLELNYWQAVIMLYRQSLSTPPSLAGEISPSEDVSHPMSFSADDLHEDEDEIFLKVAEAGQRVLKLYRQLHRVKLVNYTYLATIHLFKAGIAFLYAIWHSATVRSRLTLHDVNFTVLAATSVLRDLIDKCPPAEACCDAFDRMSKATIKMCLSTTGFGTHIVPIDSCQKADGHINQANQHDISSFSSQHLFVGASRPPVQFDMNLQDLFPEEAQDGRGFAYNLGRWPNPTRSNNSHTHPQLHSTRDDGLDIHMPRLRNNLDHANLVGQLAKSKETNDMAYDFYDFAHSNDLDFLMTANDDAAMPYSDSRLGVGMDTDHNWGDASQLDIFDGFFFGNVGNQG